ncbi:P-loop containing nucleoside triphosphate hydrolase protein [Dactylonectria estremocensis]|uniref:P-loop containing nucleoside triphosphate hydrolase protein n=1 Tax=Dactylonectria estremocensis TaxID=1079267 RepID=A0A9P9EQJ7_9HYPO|nr:P-loop containing nucleoside triphosphate hydrolase protein [Dactylonectria estremocensis]
MNLSRKHLIQMSGAPGSGKSTIAKFLAQSIDGVVINHDLIKAFFLQNDIPFGQSAKLTYSLDWVLAEDMIRQGRSVIIDSTCNFDEVLERGTALASKYGYDYKYVECRVNDIDLLDRRLRDRVPMRSQRTAVDNPPPDSSATLSADECRDLFKNWIENPRRPSGNIIVVDATNSPEESLAAILKEIAPK